MINLVQSFCRSADYPLYNIVLPAILTFVIGWYVKSKSYNFRWAKLNPACQWLTALTVGYGFVYPIYNHLFCPRLSVANGLINVLFLTQPLALALGFTLAPLLSKILKLLPSISIKAVKPESEEEKFHNLISLPITLLCLLGLYFLPNIIELVKSLVSLLDANALLALVFVVRFTAGLVGIYLWKSTINYIWQNPGRITSKVSGFIFTLIIGAILASVLGHTFGAVSSTYSQTVGWIFFTIGSLVLLGIVIWLMDKLCLSDVYLDL